MAQVERKAFAVTDNAGSGRSPDLSARLRDETAEHMTLLERLGKRLRQTMDADVERDQFGQQVSDTPSRNWARNYTGYQRGMADLLTEERERTKLRLLAERDGGHRALTDEEYDAEMRALAIEALRALPPGELEAEMQRRGLVVEPVKERDE